MFGLVFWLLVCLVVVFGFALDIVMFLARAWVLALEFELELEFGVVCVLLRVFAFEFVLLCVLGPRRLRPRPPPDLTSSPHLSAATVTSMFTCVGFSICIRALAFTLVCTCVCTLTRTCTRHRTGTGGSTCSHSLSCSRLYFHLYFSYLYFYVPSVLTLHVHSCSQLFLY